MAGNGESRGRQVAEIGEAAKLSRDEAGNRLPRIPPSPAWLIVIQGDLRFQPFV
jgi:hypothetical protein